MGCKLCKKEVVRQIEYIDSCQNEPAFLNEKTHKDGGDSKYVKQILTKSLNSHIFQTHKKPQRGERQRLSFDPNNPNRGINNEKNNGKENKRALLLIEESKMMNEESKELIDSSPKESIMNEKEINQEEDRKVQDSSGLSKSKYLKGPRHSVGIGQPMLCQKISEDLNRAKGRASMNIRVPFQTFKVDRVGESISDSYKFLGQLGNGAFGRVIKVLHKPTGGIRALKILRKNRVSENADPLVEFSLLKLLDHPNILRIFELFQDQHNYYILTEYCEGGDLYGLLSEGGILEEKKAAKYMKAILSALAYCHTRNIMHRDLKPENLMFETTETNSIIKVIDFGCSKMLPANATLSDLIGTPLYYAPEVIKGEYDLKCDIWSCGVILFLMLGGYVPFQGSSPTKIKESILAGKISFPSEQWKNISELAISFIHKMLTYNPENRISAQEALLDPWIILNIGTKKKVEEASAIQSFNCLRKFSSKESFQKAVMVFISTQLQNKSEEARLRKIFEKLDLNGDGQLSKEELLHGFKEIFPNDKQAEKEVDRILSEVDMNHNGFIDYSEFIMANMKDNLVLNEDTLKMAFQHFDIDGDGYITIDELKNILGPQVGAEGNDIILFWNEFIADVDLNGDRMIDYNEFKICMNKLLHTNKQRRTDMCIERHRNFSLVLSKQIYE